MTAHQPSALLPSLPEGVSSADWALERVRNQNPRIRGLLKAVRRLEEIGESSYYLSHCSARELDRKADAVLDLVQTLRQEVVPYLAQASPVPALEEARAHCSGDFARLDQGIVAEFERLESLGRARSEVPFRRVLGRTLGLLHGYVVLQGPPAHTAWMSILRREDCGSKIEEG